MPTIKSRINISLSDFVRERLEKLAHRDQVPEATKAADLLEIALELEEDRVWEEMADLRDTKKARYVSHAKAWK